MPHLEAQAEAQLESQNLLSGAIVLGRLPLVEFLLTKGPCSSVDLNIVNPCFGLPLSLAASHGHLGIVRYLLQSGSDPRRAYDVDSPNDMENNDWDLRTQIQVNDGLTLGNLDGSPLRAAVTAGHRDVVCLLLDTQFRLSTTKPEYFRAIIAGARAGEVSLIQLLFETIGKKISDYPHLANEMMLEACRHNRENVVKLLLDHGVDLNNCPAYTNRPKGPGPLASAIRGGASLSLIRLLLDQGAQPTIYELGRTNPIAPAAQKGRETVVDLLLNLGANPEEAFRVAAAACQSRVVAQLLTKFPDLATRRNEVLGREALRKVIMHKNPKIISLLVEAGVSLNGNYNKFRELPIYIAKETAQWIVDFLISLGAHDQEFESLPYNWPEYLEEDLEKQPSLDRVRITKRTWEWVGG